MAKKPKEKAKRPKVPKRIAGVKIPKSIRKSDLARWLIANPLGRSVVTDALVAGVAAVGSSLARNAPSSSNLRETANEAVDSGSRAAGRAGDAILSAATTIGQALSAVAQQMRSAGSPRAEEPRPPADDRKQRRGSRYRVEDDDVSHH